ncbi:transposase [Paenibacillus stellifer]|uniref:Transposase n=1 Tax=Paenibacillus stellifer TaxID=169760 RepID=A0A089M311_9BACL|nr:RNA-guided endonuclease TnpB family protein [Paenibacillus stellifer]AIQ65868.1 transposase [Paenibacillus stellifer]
MILARKVRLHPTEEQEAQLWKSAGTARWAYNWTLIRQKVNYENGGKFLSDNDLRKEITILKKSDGFNWLSEVSNNVAKQAVKDACEAFKRFFKGQSRFPRFKTRKRSTPSFYNDNLKLKVKEGKFVLIEKVGWMKTSEQIPIGVKYINPHVTYDGRYWYVSVGIKEDIRKEELTDHVIGIDLGINYLAVTSAGQVFPNINKTVRVRKIEKRLQRLQRRASRKYEMNKEGNRFVKTGNTIKIENMVRHLHRRLRNIRLNYLHQTTTAIAKTKPCVIVMEDLNINGMLRNRYLAKAIANQSFHEFIRQMKYKCEKHGIQFMQAHRFFPSSKRCSFCGEIKSDLKISDRIYSCGCGREIDRDLNAAINLANYGTLAG